MLKDELASRAAALEKGESPLTYGEYLRIPELLELQSPLKDPPAHDEMLFIIVQQIQELWFKQALYEMEMLIPALDRGDIMAALPLLQRVNRIMHTLGDEVIVLESMPPQEFQLFRNVLTTGSGFESEQFRELELASGLADPTFLKLISKHMDPDRLRVRWPRTLHDTLLGLLAPIADDPVEAVVRVYNATGDHAELYMLLEALSEYEVLFSRWRFNHIKLVQRTIGSRAPGSAGSTGVGYLGKTLFYNFFPELWEARNRLTAQAAEHPG